MAANIMFRQKLDDIQSQSEAEIEWWKNRRASIQDEFMKELDTESGAPAKISKPGSDEDAVLVDGGGPAATGSIRKKKAKK